MPVIVAGSISTFERIDLVEEINPWAYTIGSALFEHKFSEATTFRGQLEAVLNHVAGRDV
jgi:phosphoribosylformimino-5-aminoimidazole carboxamide ribonucleotide (ProFAR) isomerase